MPQIGEPALTQYCAFENTPMYISYRSIDTSVLCVATTSVTYKNKMCSVQEKSQLDL